jgi:Na+/H+-dicarboxylate symporter/ABC-type amino acid transport substrate-binding protein
MTSSTRNILIGLGLGVLVGLFLGERAALLQFAADGYLRLLQMTVLPYVMVSLITGIGSLDPRRARDLFVRVGALTLVLWALALAVVFLLPLTFPAIQNAFFFSTTLVEERAPLDFVALYIPSNPFQSLANSVVPAVVLFSAFLGAALMGIEKKEPLLGALQALERVLSRANRFSARLTPYGLLAIAAVTVGTADIEQMGRLRVFLVGYAAMSLLLALWILPGLVACVTPIPVRRILQSTRDALITAFITGDLFVVLPALIDRSKQLLEEHGFPEPGEDAPADVIVPAFYSFPHVAKVLSLSFVLFAAWYSDTEVALAARAQLALAGIVSLFGSMNAAIPFLLDLARVPSTTFQLFLATGVVNSRFGTLAAAMHMVVLALAGTYALTGRLRFSLGRILRYVLTTAAATAGTLVAVGLLLRATGMGAYDEDKVARNMQFLHPPAQKAVVLHELRAESELRAEGLPARQGVSVLEAAQERGVLRVAYIDGSMPYSFVNGRGEVVGLDVEMAYMLASELGIALELAPVPRDRLAEALDAGQCDVIMGGVFLTTHRGIHMVYSSNYIDETLAFIVPDHRRADFSSAEWIRGTPGLKVAVPELPYLTGLVHREFPGISIVPIPFTHASITDFFEGRGPAVDGLAYTAERGSFRSLFYPAFSVAVPHPVIIKLPLAYPVARHDLEAARFLSNWIDLKQKDGTITALYDHWVLGRDARPRAPRWSVLRNVLHWVN